MNQAPPESADYKSLIQIQKVKATKNVDDLLAEVEAIFARSDGKNATVIASAAEIAIPQQIST